MAGSRGPGLGGHGGVQFSREAWRLRGPQVMTRHGDVQWPQGLSDGLGWRKLRLWEGA